MSSTLNRIRKLFKDPILVRHGRKMVTTPLADALFGPISTTLGRLQQTLSLKSSFDPGIDAHSFSVTASDYAAVGLLHPLLIKLSASTPNVRIHIQSVSENTPAALLRGRTDVLILPREAISAFPTLWGDEVQREVLYRDRYVLAADQENRAVRPAMTVEQFSELPYLAATFIGGRPSLGDSNLDVLGIPRKVEVSTGFAVAPFMLRDTDLVSLIPRILATRVAKSANLQLIDPPMHLQPISETMIWPTRTDGDPAQMWFRNQLRAQAAAISMTNSS